MIRPRLYPMPAAGELARDGDGPFTGRSFRSACVERTLPDAELLQRFVRAVLEELEAMGAVPSRGRAVGRGAEAVVRLDHALDRMEALFAERPPVRRRGRRGSSWQVEPEEVLAIRERSHRVEAIYRLFSRLWAQPQLVQVLGQPAVAVGVEILPAGDALRILVTLEEDDGGEVIPFAPDTLVAEPSSWLAQLVAVWARELGYDETDFEPPEASFTRADLDEWEDEIRKARGLSPNPEFRSVQRSFHGAASGSHGAEPDEVLALWHDALSELAAALARGAAPVVDPEAIAVRMDAEGADPTDWLRTLVALGRPDLLLPALRSLQGMDLVELGRDELRIVTEILLVLDEGPLMLELMQKALGTSMGAFELADFAVRQLQRVPRAYWTREERQEIFDMFRGIDRDDCIYLLMEG